MAGRHETNNTKLYKSILCNKSGDSDKVNLGQVRFLRTVENVDLTSFPSLPILSVTLATNANLLVSVIYLLRILWYGH